MAQIKRLTQVPPASFELSVSVCVFVDDRIRCGKISGGRGFDSRRAHFIFFVIEGVYKAQKAEKYLNACAI